jgi:hypothetical protein
MSAVVRLYITQKITILALISDAVIRILHFRKGLVSYCKHKGKTVACTNEKLFDITGALAMSQQLSKYFIKIRGYVKESSRI